MNNDHRAVLPTRIVCMNPRPICPHCHKYMAIIKTAKSHLIGREGNYIVIVDHYCCKHRGCPGCNEKWIRPPNPYAGTMMLYDYEVQGEVCRIRWTEHATYKEIVERMLNRFNIQIDETAIELFLKTYEIGCTREYRDRILTEIHENGGLILCVDVMEPLQGQDGFLVAYDEWSGLTLGSFRMPNNKQSTYEGFFTRLKDRIANEIGEPILGIVSDALPTQREAIAQIFPGIPHCLCHYHFFNLVLKSTKQLDSNVITQLRESLRKLYDLKQYQFRCHENTLESSQYAKLGKFLDPLIELGNWRRKPNDPCLIGITLYERIFDIKEKLGILQTRIGSGLIPFPKHGIKVTKRLITNIENLLNEVHNDVMKLKKNRAYLTEVVEILDEFEVSAEDGLKRMEDYCDTLRPLLTTLPAASIESEFIEALVDFIDTKGPLLFNYRDIAGGPTTNNALELRFKQLKHLLRRTIGQSAAKHYLMMHGERIFFVNPAENIDQIVGILRSMDQSEARAQIKSERLSNDRLSVVIHDDVRWVIVLKDIDLYLTKLECIP